MVATALTVFFLPALYAAWFRVERGQSDTESAPADLSFGDGALTATKI